MKPATAFQFHDPNVTTRLDYMENDTVNTRIYVDFISKRIYVRNLTNDPIRRAFGVIEHPTWADFQDFLSSRVFPSSRGNAKELLQALGLDCYDPLSIIEKTGGRTMEDEMHIVVTCRPRGKAGQQA